MKQKLLSLTKIFGVIILAIALQAGSASAQNSGTRITPLPPPAPVPDDPHMGIIPAPDSIVKKEGNFIFSKSTLIKADDPKNRSVDLLKDFLINNRHLTNKISKYNPKVKSTAGTQLILTAVGAANLPAEGYKLTITPKRITVVGKGVGLFYGIQTLIQLFPVENNVSNKLPCAIINDAPRFGYRGMMLDVARHFFNVAQVKKVIELMAAYKLNNFHWHLVDGQGWRIQIKKYPKLTEVGAYRYQTMFGGNRDYLDSVQYGGFYTQDEIRDVVKFAAQRYINVVPEIEMPAHSDAALRAYPEFKCDTVAGTPAPRDINNIYCPTDATFNFLDDVLTEVMDLFPSKYIHIGGDEAGKGPWKQSAFCQNLMKEKGLKDENELQSYFIQRIEKFINSKGRTIIGWDEILEGGVAPNATVMSWQGEEGGIKAAQQRHNVIMTPQTTGNYFDHYQSGSPQEPVSFGRYAALKETYNYDPVSTQLAPEFHQYVIGTQGNLWTEYVPTVAKLQYQILPRLFALSEVAWSKPSNKDYDNFANVRLAKHFARLDAKGYNYRVPTALDAIDTIYVGQRFTYNLKSVVPGAIIYYTLNGRDPLDTDLQFDGPLNFYIPANERRELRTRVITPSGRRSIATRTVMINKVPSPAANYTANVHGLKYKLVKGKFSAPEQIDVSAAADSTTDRIDPTQFAKANPNFGIEYNGYFNAANDGAYNFTLSSYTNAQLFIDGTQLTETDYIIPLAKGFHQIKVKYFYNAPAAAPAGARPGRGGRQGSGLRITYMEPNTFVKKTFVASDLYN